MTQDMTTASPPSLVDLGSPEIDAERPNRKILVQQPSLKVVQLTLAPGQALPPHRHPGRYVLVQALEGTVTAQLEGEEIPLSPRQLLSFSGEGLVSLRNNRDAPSALLVTLVTRVNERERR